MILFLRNLLIGVRRIDMIPLIIIGYLFIGVCIVIGFIFYDYKENTICTNIEQYLERNDDDVPLYVLIGLFWPISSIIAFIGIVIPFMFKKLLIAIDRLITGAK